MFTQANLIKQEFRKHALPSCQLTHLFIICHACLLLTRSAGCGVRALKRMQPCVAVVVIVVTAEIHLTHVCHIGAKGPAQSVCQLLPELRTWLCRVPPRWEPVQPWRLRGEVPRLSCCLTTDVAIIQVPHFTAPAAQSKKLPPNRGTAPKWKCLEIPLSSQWLELMWTADD